MKSLTIIFVFLTTFSFAQEENYSWDFFLGWERATDIHNSPFWIVPDLDSARNMLQDGHEHGHLDLRLKEVHFINPDGNVSVYTLLVPKASPGKERFDMLFIGYFDKEVSEEFELQNLYIKNETDKENPTWERVPRSIYPGGTYREFAEYMHEKTGYYVTRH